MAEKKINNKDVELYRGFQKSPIFFIQKMWKLWPQPIKEGFKDLVLSLAHQGKFDEIKAEYFQPFEKGKHITWQQWKLLMAVENAINGLGSKRISVKSGHGCGKSCTLSWLIIWYLFCHLDAQVPCTAPTAEQMHDILWKELAIWKQRMPKPLGDKFDWTAGYLRVTERPETWFARAKTARKEKPEALAGVHGEFVFFVIDESCHREGTEILTKNGWKDFRNLDRNEYVLTMDNEGNARYELIQSRIMMPFDGELYEPSAVKGIDFSITPNHDLFLTTKKGREYKKIKPKDLSSRADYIGQVCINWKGEEKKIFALPTFISKRGKKLSINIQMDDWLELLGWYLSEGSLLKRKTKTGLMRYNGIVISQKKKENRVRIKNVLDRIGVLSYSENSKGYIISSIQLGNYLARFGVGFDKKRVPRYVMSLSPRQIKIFLDTFMLGDGYRKKKSIILYTSGDDLVDDLHELCCLAGYRTTKKIRILKDSKQWIIDHWAKSTKDGYYITASNYSNFTIKQGRSPLQRVKYKGMVYCVTVPSGLLYTRYNGYCMWSGNSGVPGEVFNTAEGALTGKNVLVIMISNPTRIQGYFYDSFKSDKEAWQVMTFNSEESPIVDPKFVQRIIDKHGKDSDEYRIRVLGEFPKEDAVDDKGYTPLLVEADIRFTDNADFVGRKKLGVDVAGEGSDLSTWVMRDNFRAKTMMTEKVSNSTTIALRTLTLITLQELKGDMVTVDNFGQGANVAREVAFAGTYIEAVNVGEPADDPERFINKRAEAYWRVKEWCRKGGEIVRDEILKKELLSIRFKRNLKGKIQIMSKEDMRKEGLSSPDRADALMLTFVSDDMSSTTGTTVVPRKNSQEGIYKGV